MALHYDISSQCIISDGLRSNRRRRRYRAPQSPPMHVGLWLLPVAATAWAAGSAAVCYALALSAGHVDAYLPYLSETGIRLPERCVFSLAINVFALCSLCIVWLKYWHFCLHRQSYSPLALFTCANECHLYTGSVTALSTVAVASVQMGDCFPLHVGAAVLLFGCGTCYMLGQAMLTAAATEKGGQRRPALAALRILLATVATVGVVVGISSYVASRAAEDPRLWTTDWPKRRHMHTADHWLLHVTGSTAEWLATLCSLLFTLTLAAELHELRWAGTAGCVTSALAGGTAGGREADEQPTQTSSEEKEGGL